MSERLLPASPNWYCSRSSDTSPKGVFGFGAKSSVYLVNVTAASPVIAGELKGHRERVSGFAFCRYPGQEEICASSSDDGSVKIWDSQKQATLKEHKAHQSTITSLHWSPVVKDLLVSGDEKGIVVCFWHNRNDTQSFFPEPRTIFCLSCSPHNENYIAVGYKDGMIVVIDISRKSEVLHRLRGHDDEIHALAWCPQPGEEELLPRAEETAEAEVANGRKVPDGERGCYLASGSKDQTVRVWSTARGKGVMTLKLPFLKRRGLGVDPTVKERLWLTVHWPHTRPTQIISSCFGGELLVWDLTRSGKQKWALLGSSSEGQNHTRIVFNMSSVCMGESRELLISTSMDRDVKCWDLETLDCCWTLPSLGGFVYSLTFSPVDTGSLALGVGDNMIRVWSTLSIQNRYDTKTFWQGIKSKVTALSWHPLKEGHLAFGTDDGKVGIYDSYSNKPPQISSSYHRKTVYTLAWGPPVPPLSFGGEGDRPSVTLYSCAGEGVILQHNPWKLAGEANDIDKVIRDTNGIKHKLSPHTDLSWKPDGKILAIGNEDGSIEVLQAPALRLLCSIQQHHKIINVLRWHHEHGSQPDASHLLASGSNNATVYVHNLKSVIETPSDTPVLVTEPYRSLVGHTAKITSLAWSPHHDGRLVSVCYDGTAQVWDVLKEEAICNYRGHRGRLLCVQWSPVDPDLVWTGGDDFTVQEWAVSKQEHTKPPKGKKSIELEKKRGLQPKPKAKKKKKPAGKGHVAGDQGGRGAEEGASEQEEEQEDVPVKTEHTPTTAAVSKEPRCRQPDAIVSEKNRNGGKGFSFVARESLKDEKQREKQAEAPVKKKKPRSILPISTSMDHRSREDQQRDCLTLAAVRHSQALPSNCVPGSGAHIQLGLFGDRAALYTMFEEEGRSHIEGGHYESLNSLLLWKGDLAGALQVAIEKGELTEHLVAVSPMAGYQVWVRAVEAFVKQLCFQEQYVKAASYLLSVHKVYEAIDLLKSQQLYREAIALAKARLLPEDPVMKSLYTTWAAILERDGHYSNAAKCYLAADSTYDAAKVIAKKGDVMSLKTAAELALIVGENALSNSLALRCARELLTAQDWLGAREVLQAQESLLGHQLVFCTSELLHQCLAGAELIDWSSASSHGWTVGSGVPFVDAVAVVWEREFGVSSADVEKVKLLHQQVKSVENPAATANIPIKQLLFHLSHDLTLAVLSSVALARGETVTAMLGALTRCRDATHFTLMRELCSLLLPKGMQSVSSLKAQLDHTDTHSIAAVQSLEAFVCYFQLYEMWWNQSNERPSETQPEKAALPQPSVARLQRDAQNPSEPAAVNGTGPQDTADEEQGAIPTEEGSDTLEEEPCRSQEAMLASACAVLISETHAALQTTRSVIEEIQLRLSSMMQQHLRAAATPEEQQKELHAVPESGSEQEATAASQSGASTAESTSLTSLIASVSEYNKQLAEIPEHIKRYPFPDVIECCLVILHMGRDSASALPEDLQRRCLALLLKYGTAASVIKARHKFCA